MSNFATAVAASVDRYIKLRRSLGYQFRKQAALLHTFLRYVRCARVPGPLTQTLALNFVMAGGGTPNGRAIRYGVIRRFADYHAALDPRTQSLDPRALPRSRAIPPPRILSDEELRSLMAACNHISADRPFRGLTLATLIGLLASTGLRSGRHCAWTAAMWIWTSVFWRFVRPNSARTDWSPFTQRHSPRYVVTLAIAT